MIGTGHCCCTSAPECDTPFNPFEQLYGGAYTASNYLFWHSDVPLDNIFIKTVVYRVTGSGNVYPSGSFTEHLLTYNDTVGGEVSFSRLNTSGTYHTTMVFEATEVDQSPDWDGFTIRPIKRIEHTDSATGRKWVWTKSSDGSEVIYRPSLSMGDGSDNCDWKIAMTASACLRLMSAAEAEAATFNASVQHNWTGDNCDDASYMDWTSILSYSSRLGNIVDGWLAGDGYIIRWASGGSPDYRFGLRPVLAASSYYVENCGSILDAVTVSRGSFGMAKLCFFNASFTTPMRDKLELVHDTDLFESAWGSCGAGVSTLIAASVSEV